MLSVSASPTIKSTPADSKSVSASPTIKSTPADSKSLKDNLLMYSLTKYYDTLDESDMTLFTDIIAGKSKISLRIIDWFVTNYSKKNNVVYYVPKKKGSIKNKKKFTKQTYQEAPPPNLQKYDLEQFIVYLRYRSKLKSYNKSNFDPFCRNNRITEWGKNRDITTTIGQLNFFRWAIDKNIIEYIKNHLKEIEIDMNTNIRKHIPSDKKKLSKGVNHLTDSKSLKRKRRELSMCATKTVNRHNVNITLSFD
jgi:hypothetical protein